MLAKLFIVSMFFVGTTVFSAPGKHPGLRCRRLSSDSSEIGSLSPRRGITKKDLGCITIEATGEELTDPDDMHLVLTQEIARLMKMQEEEATHIEALKAEMSGILSPVMRVLNVWISGVEPAVMLKFFEEHQLEIAVRLAPLIEALRLVDEYLRAQKTK